jgi:ribosomal protein S18 acetylase RimI-like enzyme
MAVTKWRRARHEDVPDLLALQAVYYAQDGYPFDPSAARKAWRRLLENESLGRSWIAHASADAVGYVVLTLGYSLEYRGRDAFIDELYVTPSFQGRGLGGEALALVERACIRLGIHALHLEVERGKAGAQALYRGRGFASTGRVLMTKKLDAEQG